MKQQENNKHNTERLTVFVKLFLILSSAKEKTLQVISGPVLVIMNVNLRRLILGSRQARTTIRCNLKVFKTKSFVVMQKGAMPPKFVFVLYFLVYVLGTIIFRHQTAEYRLTRR